MVICYTATVNEYNGIKWEFVFWSIWQRKFYSPSSEKFGSLVFCLSICLFVQDYTSSVMEYGAFIFALGNLCDLYLFCTKAKAVQKQVLCLFFFNWQKPLPVIVTTKSLSSPGKY